MADGSTIEWTDATWQIVTGCSVVSPGCTNCYAMRLAGTRLRNHPSRKGLTTPSKAGPVWNGQVRFNFGWLQQPLRWRKRRDIFVAAHGDLFHAGVQRWMLVQVFAVMAMAHWHRFQVLTKRADLMREFVTWVATAEGQWEMARAIEKLGIKRFYTWPLPNVWLGVSVEDQRRAQERIPLLLATPAAVRWISGEPLLGPLVMDGRNMVGDETYWNWLKGERGATVQHVAVPPERTAKIDWIVAGGESGPSARPSHPDWFRSLRDQCETAGVPFFFKQWGAWGPVPGSPRMVREGDCFLAPGGSGEILGADLSSEMEDVATPMRRVGKKAAGAVLDGREHREFPAMSDLTAKITVEPTEPRTKGTDL